MLQSRLHLIVTMRAKTEYVLETNEKGKQVPRKVGLAPVQRDGLEYEFDVVADMDLDNNLIVSKSRCEALSGAVIAKPGKEVADTLKAWLTDGAPVQETPQTQPATRPAPTTNGAANATPNRDDLNAMALAYLHKAHRMSPQDYADFIGFRLGAKPDKVDVAKLKPLADYCNAAAQGNENAKAGVKKAVQEWRDAKRATGEAQGEMQPDPVPGYEQEVLA